MVFIKIRKLPFLEKLIMLLQTKPGDILNLLYNERLRGRPEQFVANEMEVFERLMSEKDLVHFGTEFYLSEHDRSKLAILKLKVPILLLLLALIKC